MGPEGFKDGLDHGTRRRQKQVIHERCSASASRPSDSHDDGASLGPTKTIREDLRPIPKTATGASQQDMETESPGPSRHQNHPRSQKYGHGQDTRNRSRTKSILEGESECRPSPSSSSRQQRSEATCQHELQSDLREIDPRVPRLFRCDQGYPPLAEP